MIDIENIVEQLMQASKDTENVSRAKMTIILCLVLKNHCDNISDVVYKYENQWSKTKTTSLSGIEDNDPAARLIRLLFNLIHDDIRDIRDEHDSVLTNTDPRKC